MMPRILAVDLGNKTGLAWNYGDAGAITLWLSTPKEVRDWGQARLTRTCDPRISRLYQHLSGRCKDGLDIVVFEDVQFSTYTAQTQLWSSFRSALWLACKAHARIECVPVTTLKKFATGSGAADKAAMRRAMMMQFPDTRPALDDNAIDALWILKWAERNLSRMK